MLAELEKLVVMLKQRLDKHGASGSTLTLKLKYADYRQLTRSRTVGSAISDIETIRSIAMALFALLTVDQQKVRLLGLTVSDLHAEQITDDGVQLRLEVLGLRAALLLSTLEERLIVIALAASRLQRICSADLAR